MHKDPPPTLFDARRPLSHVVSHGLLAGFLLSVVVHFGWTLWRQSSGTAAAPAGRGEALVSGIATQRAATGSPSPPAADLRY
jgi:hypothetical protein